MNKFIVKEKRNRKVRYLLEHKHAILKSICYNSFIEKTTKMNATIKLSILTKQSNKICFVNRCIFTGRKNRVNKLYNISRLVFLRLARNNDIKGVKKSVW